MKTNQPRTNIAWQAFNDALAMATEKLQQQLSESTAIDRIQNMIALAELHLMMHQSDQAEKVLEDALILLLEESDPAQKVKLEEYILNKLAGIYRCSNQRVKARRYDRLALQANERRRTLDNS